MFLAQRVTVCVAEARVSVTSVFFSCSFCIIQHNFTFCDVSIFVDVMINELNELPDLLNPFTSPFSGFYIAKRFVRL